MEKVLLPRGYGRSYDACKHAIEHDCDIVAPDRSGVIALEYIIKDICKNFDSLEIDRITFSDYVDSVIINHHKFNGVVEAIEIRLYDVRQYFEHEMTERGRRKDVVFDDIDRCMQVLCPYRKISMVTMEVEE
jgi:hypothetical protein|nr:MAG TPA: hypothetical protein [Caudoviricetes sp.]